MKKRKAEFPTMSIKTLRIWLARLNGSEPIGERIKAEIAAREATQI